MEVLEGCLYVPLSKLWYVGDDFTCEHTAEEGVKDVCFLSMIGGSRPIALIQVWYGRSVFLFSFGIDEEGVCVCFWLFCNLLFKIPNCISASSLSLISCLCKCGTMSWLFLVSKYLQHDLCFLTSISAASFIHKGRSI